jgi:hypothetical protein
MKWISVLAVALNSVALFGSCRVLEAVKVDLSMADPTPCKLERRDVLRTRKSIIGLSLLPSQKADDQVDLLVAFKDGTAAQVPTNELYSTKEERHVKKFLLAPAYGDREDCDTSSLEDVEFSSMAVSICGAGKHHGKSLAKTFFAYHKKGDDFPSASYALRGPGSRWFCQVFPTTPHPLTALHSTSFAQPGSTELAVKSGRFGNLIFMVDYDNNDLLVQVGTTKEDCDNPLVRRHFHKKITAFGSCCYLPFVFLGFENGEIGIYWFKTTDNGCRGKLVCFYLFPAPCGCTGCADAAPVPVGFQLCCAKPVSGKKDPNSKRFDPLEFLSLATVQLNVLYRQQSRCKKDEPVKTFLQSTIITIGENLLTPYSAEYFVLNVCPFKPIVNSEIVDFRVCCGSRLQDVYLIVRSCDGSLRLLQYSLLNGPKFIGQARLPCQSTIKSWTLIPYPSKKLIAREVKSKDDNNLNEFLECLPVERCCALFAFDLPASCNDCERCPPKSGLSLYCCGQRRLTKEV